MNTTASSRCPWPRTLPIVCLSIAAVALGGCAQFGGRDRVTSGYPITPERAGIIQMGVTTHGQIFAEFGGKLNPPQWTWLDGRGIAYTWTTTNGWTKGFGILADPSAGTWVQQTEHAFCLVFDECDRVVRTQDFRARDEDELRKKVEQWMGVPVPHNK